MSSENIRKLILWGALAATLLAVVWVDDENDQHVTAVTTEVVEPSRHVASRARVDRRINESLPIEQLGKRKFSAEADDIFTITTWEPKRPAVNSAAPTFVPQQIKAPPPPAITQTAPPLQFKYLGRVTDGLETHIFLSQADKNHIAKVGGRIEDQYRVDRIKDDAIELTYLPLGIKQTLLINDDKNPGRIQ